MKIKQFEETLSPRLEEVNTMSKTKVKHRDGRITDLDITKIRDMANWSCQGIDVNPVSLESGMSTRLTGTVSTEKIQATLIGFALELCSIDNPDWRLVAGRLVMREILKKAILIRGVGYGINFADYLEFQVAENIYNDELLHLYSREQLIEAGTWIDGERDYLYDYAGAVLLKDRYLLPEELPQEAYMTIALLLASQEQNKMTWAKRFYDAISLKKISLATPILANLRSRSVSLTSCFIMSMDDNLESIFSSIHECARISKQGGGMGVDLSRVRCTGSRVMGNPNSSGGVLPWIKILNDTAIAVNQGGKRSGAITVSIDSWHLDVLEFLEMQTENGDQRRKSYDVFPQLVLSDEFMKRVEKDEMWTLVDPLEVREVLGVELCTLWGREFSNVYGIIEESLGIDIFRYKVISARKLFKSIMRTQLETGMPYLAFKDTINRANPNKHEGYIPGVNLCTESFSNVEPGKYTHCCNLVSLNLSNLNESEIPMLTEIAVRMLDNTIDIGTPPTQSAIAHNTRYRVIGVGAMGLADWLAARKLSYKSLTEIGKLFENISYGCIKASVDLAEERGAYPAFEGSDWSKGKLFGRDESWFSDDRWKGLIERAKKGIRNSQLTAIAPNTSSSLVQGCTSSILPVYSRFYYDKWSKGTVPVSPPFLKERYWFYEENKTMDQQNIVNAVSEIQKWIDTGISMELVFNLNKGVYEGKDANESIKAKDIYEVLMSAWKKGCKAIYYVRTVQKDDFRAIDECSTCAN